MSTDSKVTKDLIQTCRDGQEGFANAAEKLTSDGRDDLANRFHEFSHQRADFAAELEKLAAEYGEDDSKSSSAAAAIHRGWMSVKDAMSGSDPAGVLDAAEQGEDHAKSEYAKALEEDLSPSLKAVVQRQYSAVQSAHDTVRDLRDAQAA